MNLRKEIRQRVLEKVLEHRFKGNYLKLADDFAKLAHEAYDATYPKAMQRRMNRLPDKWLPQKDHIVWSHSRHGWYYLYFDAYNVVSRGGRDRFFYCPKAPQQSTFKRMLYCDFDGPAPYDPSNPITQKLFALLNQNDVLGKQYEEARAQALWALSRYRTVKALQTGWPEMYDLCKKTLKEDVALPVPVADIGFLNKVFKLPPEVTT